MTTGRVYGLIAFLQYTLCDDRGCGEQIYIGVVNGLELFAYADWECTNSNGDRRVYAEKYEGGDCQEIKAQPEPKRKPFKSNPKEARKAMAEGKASVLSILKDPDSAKFSNLVVRRDAILCGSVNAKNSYGGYTGSTRFYSLGMPGLTHLDDGSREFLERYASLCSDLTEDQIKATRSN